MIFFFFLIENKLKRLLFALEKNISKRGKKQIVEKEKEKEKFIEIMLTIISNFKKHFFHCSN